MMATEKRLIDANDAISKLEDELFMCKPVSMDDGYLEAYKKRVIPKLLRNVIDWVENQPTVDAVEVVHGRWLYDSGSGKHFCSACDEDALSFKKDTLYGGELYEVCLTDYCPNCGAKMDGERKDNESNY